jgi:hypothetical protein
MSEFTVTGPELTQPDPRANLSDNIAENASRLATGWHGEVPLYGIDSTTREVLGKATDSVVQAAAAYRASETEAVGWESNLDLHPDGRKARAAAARQAGIDSANEHLSNAQTLTAAAEALLIDASAPSLGDTESKRQNATVNAKHDIELLASTAKNNGELMDRLRYVAESDSPASTLVTSGSYIDTLLMSKGIGREDRDQMKSALVEFALATRANRGDQAARLAYQLRRNLKAAVGSARTLRRRNR